MLISLWLTIMTRRRVTLRLPEELWQYVEAEQDRNPYKSINDILCELMLAAIYEETKCKPR